MLTIAIPELYEQFSVAEFQFSAVIKQYPTHFCFNKRLAYIYDVIVKKKQISFGVVNLKSTYAIELKEACHGDEFKLAKIGRLTWREFNIPS